MKKLFIVLLLAFTFSAVTGFANLTRNEQDIGKIVKIDKAHSYDFTIADFQPAVIKVTKTEVLQTFLEVAVIKDLPNIQKTNKQNWLYLRQEFRDNIYLYNLHRNNLTGLCLNLNSYITRPDRTPRDAL